MGSEPQINLVCCTQVIKDEIFMGISRKDIAVIYALAIKSEMQGADRPDWKEINHAIIARWDFKSLDAVKKRAFDILRGKIDPSGKKRASRPQEAERG